MNRYVIRVSLLSVAALLFAAAPARAVTYTFTGKLTNVFDPTSSLGGAFAVGDPFTGSFTYQYVNVPDANGSPSQGSYILQNPPNKFTFTVNGATIKSATGNLDAYVSLVSGGDSFGLYSSNPDVTGFVLPVGANGVSATTAFLDPTNTVLLTDALPNSADPADYATTFVALQFSIIGLGDGGHVQVGGEVDSFVRVASTPEPATALLGVVSVGGLAAAATRRRVR